MTSRAAAGSARDDSFSKILRWLAEWLQAVMTHSHRRATIKALQELDDRELRDIGLLRSQIEDVINGKLRRWPG